jgi:hypothetical protein
MPAISAGMRRASIWSKRAPDDDSVCICARSSNRTPGLTRTTATYAEFTRITVMSDLSLPGCLCIPFVYRTATSFRARSHS